MSFSDAAGWTILPPLDRVCHYANKLQAEFASVTQKVVEPVFQNTHLFI